MWPMGTYVEQVSIVSKDLTLQGAGETTIIKSPATLVDSYPMGSVNPRSVVTAKNGSVTIKNLAIDGDSKGAANPWLMGLSFYNADGGAEDIWVTGVRGESTGWAGNTGWGVNVIADEVTPHAVVLKRLHVVNFQKNGIKFITYGTESDLTVSLMDSTVTGDGVMVASATSAGQNGIVCDQNKPGTKLTCNISGNTVSQILYDNPTYAGTSILVTRALATVSGNTVTNSQTGTYRAFSAGNHQR